MPPFVVQLLGEYVVQIADGIAQGLPGLDPAAYQRFAADNPPFLDLTCRRGVSYWEYYCSGRHPFPEAPIFQFAEYPSFRVLKSPVMAATGIQGRSPRIVWCYRTRAWLDGTGQHVLPR